jgi:hypothetical protein
MRGLGLSGYCVGLGWSMMLRNKERSELTRFYRILQIWGNPSEVLRWQRDKHVV